MNDTEIQQLLSTVDDDLRIRWQNSKKTKDLFELKKTRMRAIEQQKLHRKLEHTINFFLPLFTIVACIVFLVFGIQKGTVEVVFLLIFLVSMVIPFFFLNLWFCSVSVARKIDIERYDKVFEDFRCSMSSLNPSGRYSRPNTIVTIETIEERAIDIAQKIIQAETYFDKVRKDPKQGRNEVIQSGMRIELYQTIIELFLRTTRTDFGIVLDKATMFKRAQDQLGKDQA